MDTAHLPSLFEHATEGIILTTGQGPVILINPAAEKMFGYKASEIIGQPIEVLIPQRLRDRHVHHRQAFSQHPQNRVMGHGRDLFGRRKDGSEIPVEVSLSFYNRDGEMFVIAFIVDITHRKQIEHNMLLQQKELELMADNMRKLNAQLEAKVEERTLILKEALLKLEQSQNELSEALSKEKRLNEIKSQFVSIASHEFRTPLSTVLSSASLLSKYTTTEEQASRERHVEKIRSAVRNLNNILEDFLSLGKLDEGKVDIELRQFYVRDLIKENIDEMAGLLKNGQEFSCRHEEEGPVYLDRNLLKNIIINLLANAIKFSGEQTVIAIHSKVTERLLTLGISDQGIGIPEDDQAHLFSSFYRARNATNIEGTGLGLHIIKRYLSLLSGSIAVSSVLDKGTTFTITIPFGQPKLFTDESNIGY